MNCTLTEHTVNECNERNEIDSPKSRLLQFHVLVDKSGASSDDHHLWHLHPAQGCPAVHEDCWHQSLTLGLLQLRELQVGSMSIMSFLVNHLPYSQDSRSRFGGISINVFEVGHSKHALYIYMDPEGKLRGGPTDMILADIISPALDSQHHWPVLSRGSNYSIHLVKIKLLGI